MTRLAPTTSDRARQLEPAPAARRHRCEACPDPIEIDALEIQDGDCCYHVRCAPAPEEES